MKKFRTGRKWLKAKLRRGCSESQKQDRKIVIGPPTNFRRENITLGKDVDGNAILIERAREDAQAMHRASQTQLRSDTA
ncbi:hypothetical protein HRR83_004661 [Exophiala dermatitidis]|uniref:Uncharacterized protein n=2 Tax=Exophiala dermatitidis TaxID=5970 RepID=H6BRR4_EXODN|nr:uncharacterized protein HMPREF1120_02193 [Exophiala dermatitidis NIH/UT8656]KAJ4515636.1 hypothetical protein HRR75_003715 [Exophiala dermatitidis]EHY54016.1 hypothetical protein HMPREF1120_02193 [Exophiala dermatitidis NIH/UT8656]KAJ4519317.1 hypothetical protein HRR74_004058 [Exophiala dermatitidis]KAJ4529133.1 hypothetical protein HRR73_000153 [Exophiala dermatitidis]KAJ4538533.1 hypothetical protein HRR77_007016 [Exophiala dermatitidis]